jgi:RsiW-degrading membrane proteinase PrsW (M82 family)
VFALDSLALLLKFLVVAAPVAAFFLVLHRASEGVAERRKNLLIALGTSWLGAIAYMIAWLIERRLQAMAGLDAHARATTDVPALVYAFFVAAPIEQGLKVAAVGPVWRSRHFAAPIEGVAFASAAALGFVSAHDAVFLSAQPLTGANLARALLAPPAHVFFAAAWGYALGREAKERSSRCSSTASTITSSSPAAAPR